jgi:predicted helicase
MVDNNKIEKDIKNYFKEVYSIYSHGDYTEWTYRTPFENFIKGLNADYNLTQEPKRAAGLGAPDFKAFYNNRKIGFIETKDLGENLDKILETDQLKKYIESIDNLILTNYLQFVLIRKGRKVYDCNLFMLSDLDKRNLSISKEKIETFASLINEFFEYKLPTIVLAEELALELSKRAKLLKELAKDQLLNDLEKIKNNESPSLIYDFYLGIKELIKDVKLEDCADAYAQTITYGLFLAKRSCRGKLDRITAASYIPKNVGVIKRIFLNISGEEFPSNISWIVDDIIDILNAAKIEEILKKIDKRGKKDKDPIIFFYEDFLNYYEPEKRKHLGVYYTPRPVVNFIVNSVHSILKKHFDKSLGLANDSVNVLDPAIGTGTFFWITFLVALGELKNQGLRGIIFDKIENHLLKHFYGFEILITPYVISHLKITDLLRRWHYRFKDEDRIQVYLTNTLEESEVHDPLLFMREITEESRIANQIKTEKPILVIIGNPPYSGISANKGKWIDDLLKKGYTRADGSKDDGYYTVDGKSLEERKLWLQDDYVKFIRYAQWKIDQNGEGVVGFITNHSYLDNPTFRGMRESILQSFDRIYILNLHGNSLKKEKCPDGSKDENVFDIQQGVAIGIFIKNKNLGQKKIYYTDLWGLRDSKYHWLDRHTIDNVKWQEVKPISPFYFFVPKDTTFEEEYNKFWKVTDIFPVNCTGIVTARDKFVIDFDKDTLRRRIERFRDLSIPDDAFKLKENYMWRVKKARNDLNKVKDWDKYFEKILYRPFDIREIYFHDSVVWRTRSEVMKHMLKENLGLITVRQVKAGEVWQHCWISDGIIESSYISNKTSEINYLFPLYLYSDFEKKANIDPDIYKTLSEKYNKELTPEEIFYYIYAIFYSPTYRKRYGEFLQFDFPRIPFIDNYEIFKKLAELGKELVELHLMRKRLPTKVKFDVIGSNVVEKVKYENGKVWINKEQYFDGVPEEIWDFYIGGYQVLDKWLKSRKNRKLESKDIEQFLQIVEIISETIRLMKEIDKVNIP